MEMLWDKCGWEEGGMLMGVTFLTKATSPKWELTESIRSRHLLCANFSNHLEIWSNTIYFVGRWCLCVDLVDLTCHWQHPDDVDTEVCWRRHSLYTRDAHVRHSLSLQTVLQPRTYKTQNKHRCGFVQTVEYTEISEIGETTHIQYQ